MTNEQFYIAVGAPILAILVGMSINALMFLSLNSRMSALETRVENLQNRIESRIQNLENTFTTRFDLLMGRLIELEKEIHKQS